MKRVTKSEKEQRSRETLHDTCMAVFHDSLFCSLSFSSSIFPIFFFIICLSFYFYLVITPVARISFLWSVSFEKMNHLLARTILSFLFVSHEFVDREKWKTRRSAIDPRGSSWFLTTSKAILISSSEKVRCPVFSLLPSDRACIIYKNLVPPPHDEISLITRYHRRTGYFLNKGQDYRIVFVPY